MSDSHIELGTKVRDTVTGFEGTAVARCEYFNGCVQYGVLPKAKEAGAMPDAVYIDWQRLEVVGKPKVPRRTSLTGGPQRDAPTW